MQNLDPLIITLMTFTSIAGAVLCFAVVCIMAKKLPIWFKIVLFILLVLNVVCATFFTAILIQQFRVDSVEPLRRILFSA